MTVSRWERGVREIPSFLHLALTCLEMQAKGKTKKRQKELGKISRYVFTNESGTDKIKDFRGAWEKGCKDANIGKKLFHDFRSQNKIGL